MYMLFPYSIVHYLSSLGNFPLGILHLTSLLCRGVPVPVVMHCDIAIVDVIDSISGSPH